MEYDVIVIGSGLAGLTAAATLAVKNKKVLVLERHNIAGGCATVFNRNGMKFETGLHEMDYGKYNRDMKHIIFHRLGISKTLPIIKLPELWSIKTEKETITIKHGYKDVVEILTNNFPEERDGIVKYFNGLSLFIYSIRKLPYDMSLLDFFFYPITTLPLMIKNILSKETIGGFLDKIIKSDRLKRILNINLAYYHDDPHNFSFSYHASAQGNYYNSGVFIKGGSQTLSNSFVDIIERHGGEVKLSSEAKHIEVYGKKAKYVEWFDKKTKETHKAEAKIIIANCAPSIVYNDLLDKKYEDKTLKELKDSCSLYTVYISFKKKMKDLFPENSYSTFITTESNLESPFKNMGKEIKESSVENRDFVFVDYSAIDSGLVKESDNRSFGVLCGTSYLSEWESLSDEEYKNKKENLAKILFEKMEKHYNGFTDNIEYYEVSTPKTIKRYINTPSGTAYGYEQKFFGKGRVKRKSTTVKNIHFASAWAFPGGGFTGAIISGYMAARNILFNTPLYIVLRTLLCIFIGTLVGTSHLWIPAIIYFFK